MRTLRAILRLIFFTGATLFYYLLIMLALLGSVFDLNYERVRGFFLNKWGRACCRIIGMKVSVYGSPPKPPFFLVSNHLSYTDIFLLFSQLRCLFVAKSDVKEWPLFGKIIKSCGILFIDRERKRDVPRVNQLISENITDEQGIIVFPESTTSAGEKILPFRSSLLEYPASTKFPVSYSVIRYETPENETHASDSVCWWSDISFFSHFFELLKMKEFSASVTFGSEKVIAEDRKALAKLLKEKIKSEFVPVIQPEKHAKANIGS